MSSSQVKCLILANVRGMIRTGYNTMILVHSELQNLKCAKKLIRNVNLLLTKIKLHFINHMTYINHPYVNFYMVYFKRSVFKNFSSRTEKWLFAIMKTLL